jgi:hypothetical protein
MAPRLRERACPFVSSWSIAVSAQDAYDARPASDYQSAISEYHASRARYIRTVTSNVEQRFLETIGKRRDSLREEIANLTELAQHRYENYQTNLKAYATKAPGRVTGGGIMPPSAAERIVRGIDKLYKIAIHAADEFREVNDIIRKRKDKLGEIDYKLREQVEQFGRDLIAQLETDVGLEGAFKRDPLLGRAHARMLAARARQTSILSP